MTRYIHMHESKVHTCPCGRDFFSRFASSKYCPRCNVPAAKKQRIARMHQRREKQVSHGDPRLVPHPTVSAFLPIWAVVRAEAVRTRDLGRSLRRGDVALEHGRLRPEVQDTIRWACRYRLTEGPDAHLVGNRRTVGRPKRGAR